MSYSEGRTEGTDSAWAFIEELLRTSFALWSTLASLLEELPEHAFPGEDNATVLFEMVVGSCRPALEAAGERECREAAALIGAIGDRVFNDLRTAAELAGPER